VPLTETDFMKEHNQEARVMLLLRVPQLLIHTSPYILNLLWLCPHSHRSGESPWGKVGHTRYALILAVQNCARTGVRPAVVALYSVRHHCGAFKLPQGLQRLAGILVRKSWRLEWEAFWRLVLRPRITDREGFQLHLKVGEASL
jgi:hypothetical protein